MNAKGYDRKSRVKNESNDVVVSELMKDGNNAIVKIAMTYVENTKCLIPGVDR